MPKQSHSGSPRGERVENVACPFCPLLCDDLVIETQGDSLAVQKNGCAQAVTAFEQPRNDAKPLVAGQRASRTVAIGAAIKILKRASAPHISGLCTDVDGARTAVELAEKSRGTIDHADSTGLDSGMRVLQSRGWYTTTLAEVRNRADLVVLVGANVVDHYANFMRRVVEPKQTLHSDRRRRRRVFYLGDQRSAPASTKSCTIESIRVAPADMAATIGVLRATLANRATTTGAAKRLAGLAEAISAAEYPVFVWAPAQLAPDSADVTIAAVTRLIDELNETRRAAGLPLGGDNGAMSAVNTCAWLTGYPLHISFAGKTIEYDPVRYRTSELLTGDAVDALVWIDAFGVSPMPATAAGVKRIAIGCATTISNTSADVFIPIGTPGVDHPGRLIRTDSVVTLHVDQLRARRTASAADVLRELIAQW